MIVNSINVIRSYGQMHPLFPVAIDFLTTHDLAKLPDGEYEIKDREVYAIVASGLNKGRAAAFLEAHDRYIDIQCCIAGEDVIGVKQRATCHKVREPYDQTRDIVFFNDTPDDWCVLYPATFMVLFPEDAHAPLAGEGPFKKIVVKVKAAGSR